jgi:hypothetical protein
MPDKKLYRELSKELKDSKDGSHAISDDYVNSLSNDGFTTLQGVLNTVISENPDRVFEVKHDDKFTYFVWRKLES